MDLLVTVLIVLIVLGLALYLVNNFLPMDARIKMIINAVIVILAIVYLLRVAGILGGSASLD
ncbi:MAG: Thivi_2564 family membrane protein [Gammaproteobacteria bacterium]